MGVRNEHSFHVSESITDTIHICMRMPLCLHAALVNMYGF
jgi:hypothetical protein